MSPTYYSAHEFQPGENAEAFLLRRRALGDVTLIEGAMTDGIYFAVVRDNSSDEIHAEVVYTEALTTPEGSFFSVNAYSEHSGPYANIIPSRLLATLEHLAPLPELPAEISAEIAQRTAEQRANPTWETTLALDEASRRDPVYRARSWRASCHALITAEDAQAVPGQPTRKHSPA